MVGLRPMRLSDLDQVKAWLGEPHVARWWLGESSVENELQKLSQRLAAGAGATVHLLIVERRDRRDGATPQAIGWCQWYRYDASPEQARVLHARDGDCGMDYAIGEPSAIRRGLGAQMLARLVHTIGVHNPRCGLLVACEAANTASRRLLEGGGFHLQSVGPVSTEPHDRPMAIYRRDGAASHGPHRRVRETRSSVADIDL